MHSLRRRNEPAAAQLSMMLPRLEFTGHGPWRVGAIPLRRLALIGGAAASVTVRADGAVFQSRYLRGATRTPCSLSTWQIDSTLKPRAGI
jgi:hypothetical protein